MSDKTEIIECHNPNCCTPIKIFPVTGEEMIFCNMACLHEYMELGEMEERRAKQEKVEE